MKQLFFRFTIPITIISFFLVTKWWFGFVIDGKDVFLYGFPFIYYCEGFHTSMSTQYFLLAFVIDLVVYLLFWLSITYLLHRKFQFKVAKKLWVSFWFLVVLLVGCWTCMLGATENSVQLQRNFDLKIFHTGVSFLGGHPFDYDNY